MQRKHVVIVGGGFGGLSAAKVLGRNSELEVTLVDQRNHHLFQPLLYQVATAGLSPAEIAMPIRSVLAGYPNLRVVLDRVIGIDLKANVVRGSRLQLSYDYLLLACGATHSYFGHPDWESFAPGLKTLEQATEIRRRILLAFEDAEKETDPQRQREYLNFVIVGGGPTGVEMAGAIAEISRFTLAKDFKRIDPTHTQVTLIEAGDRILSAFDPILSRRAERDLKELGVQILTRTRVTEVNANGIKMGDRELCAHTVIWAAGVKPSSLNETLAVTKDSLGRIMIDPDLRIHGIENAFCIGDQSHFSHRGQALPGLAPVAIQQGRAAALNILRLFKSQPLKPFDYFDKGMMATIGRRKAVLQFRKLTLQGFLAWAGWLFVHIFYLIGFKNRFFVFIQWAWSYLTFKRGARLIVNKEWRSE